MKKVIIWVCAAVFLFAGAAVYGQQNPLLGTWDFQMVFVPGLYRFEFKDDGTYTVEQEGSGEPEQWEYYINEEEPIVTLQMNDEEIMDWRYRFPPNEPDTIYFYVSDGNDWFVEQFTHALFEIRGEEANDLTSDFVDSLVEAIAGVFEKEAFMKGSRQ